MHRMFCGRARPVTPAPRSLESSTRRFPQNGTPAFSGLSGGQIEFVPSAGKSPSEGTAVLGRGFSPASGFAAGGEAIDFRDLGAEFAHEPGLQFGELL